jgi:rod shape-determining protein MreD
LWQYFSLENIKNGSIKPLKTVSNMSVTLYLKLLLPKVLAILFIFLSYVPVGLFGLDSFFPAADIMLIYYWCVHRPQVMRSWFIFSIGLLKDILSGAPLGANSLSYLILRGLSLYKGESLRRSFILMWQGFAIFLAIILLLKWFIFAFVFEKAPGINAAVMQFLLSVFVYPLFHSLFNILNLTLPRND